MLAIATYRCTSLSEEIASGCFLVLESFISNFGNIYSLDVDFGTGCKSVGLVDTLDWHAINLVRSGNEEKS